MKKKIKLNKKNLKTLINESFNEDSFTLDEDKLDKIIKNYLLESSETYEINEKTVSNTTNEIISEFESQIDDFIGEIGLMNDIDGDILLENKEYLDEKLYLIEGYLNEVKKVINSIKNT